MNDLDLALTKHKYKLANGDIAVNVTSLSGLIDDGKSSAMAGAAAKITREGGDHRKEWKAKADRGTRVHDHCEAFLRGKEIDCLPEDSGFVDGVEKFMVDKHPRVIELEQIALSNLGYGGRFDMIVEIDGRIGLVDLKTGKEYAVEHTLQLSAYRFADGIAEYDEAGMLAELRPMPEIDFCACLYVREDGTYDLVEYPADTEAWHVFLLLLDAYNWTRSPEIKTIANAWRKAK